MIGAIVGDVVGSVYEFNNIKTKDFPFFQQRAVLLTTRSVLWEWLNAFSTTWIPLRSFGSGARSIGR